jgi:hypothetical protein
LSFFKFFFCLVVVASDSRWRVRESVAMALQTLIEENSEKTLVELAKWVECGSSLVMRAVAAGVAEPVLLKDQRTAKAALDLHKSLLKYPWQKSATPTSKR